MKRILFDFITFEDKIINGGALVTKSILIELSKKQCEIFGICRNPDDVDPQIREFAKINNIKFIDIKKDINAIIDEYSIDSFFIGIYQRYNSIDLSGLKCKLFVLIHDVVDICLYNAGLLYDYESYYFIYKNQQVKLPKLRCYYTKIKKILQEKSLLGKGLSLNKQYKKMNYENFTELLRHDNVYLITVSNYSRSALEYYFQNIANEIKVFYPSPIIRCKNSEEQLLFPELINKEFFLLLSANRYNKNVKVFLSQFARLNELYNNRFKAVIVGLKDIGEENIICYQNVSDSQLEQLEKNCFALIYPSLGEGFGLPPIEVMSYGKPVIVAYDTSIPEICGNNVLYFNPLYEEDLFYKERILIENYDYYRSFAKEIADKVVRKQFSDTEKLIDFILS